MGKGVKKALKKAGRAIKKAGKRIANDPQIKAEAKAMASQFKSELIRGVKQGMATATGGRITGSGDYVFSRNFSSSYKGRISVANSIVIEREETVAFIVSNATAKLPTIQKFRVNPGNYGVFPWGSSVALGYESWEPLGMQFYVESSAGEMVSSSDNSLGTVILAAQYNTYARDWDSIMELENANDSVYCKVSQSPMLGIECKRNLRGAKSLYVSQSDPDAAGKAFYDLCDVFVGTYGLQGTSVRVGALKVRYRIKLFNPIMRDSEFPTCRATFQGTVASAGHAIGTAATIVENFSTKVSGSVVATNENVATFTCRPLVGRARLRVTHNHTGASGSRVSPTITVAATSLGTSLAGGEADSVGSTTVYWRQSDEGADTETTAVTVIDYVLPVNTDGFTLTFGSCTGVASDQYNLIVEMEPFETSDF